ncbi:MAG: hypothetical protein VYC34_01605, partial [Planctomycetota bacterium]|nr:hypothetical protein [Planctomycetota bacterium]
MVNQKSPIQIAEAAPRQSFRRARTLPFLIAAALLLSACAGPRSPQPTPVPLAASAEAADAQISTTVRGPVSGLEALLWHIAAEDAAEAAALARWRHEPSPLPPEIEQRWRRSGLRVIRVPVDDLPAVRDALPICGRLERRWLGQA